MLHGMSIRPQRGALATAVLAAMALLTWGGKGTSGRSTLLGYLL
jgi:hypothetical protein